MRSLILSAIQGLSSATLGTFQVATDLPYEQDGNPLYFKNFKRIYVDAAQYDQSPDFDTLKGDGWVNETITVRAYFVTDAKQLPSNYTSLVETIKELRLSSSITGVIQKLCSVSTEFQGDAMITEFEFSFKKYLN